MTHLSWSRWFLICLNVKQFIILIIEQVYWLSTVHYQVTPYSHGVPGCFNPVLSVSQRNLFWQKITSQIVSFQLMLGLEEHYSPSPLGDLCSWYCSNQIYLSSCLIRPFRMWRLYQRYHFNWLLICWPVGDMWMIVSIEIFEDMWRLNLCTLCNCSQVISPHWLRLWLGFIVETNFSLIAFLLPGCRLRKTVLVQNQKIPW